MDAAAAASDGPAARIEPDGWLATVLARPTFRVAIVDPSGGEPLLSHARRHAGGFYYAKVATSDVASVALLETAGMRTVDVNVTMTLSAPARSPGPGPQTAEVHEVWPSEVDEVIAIAGRSFRYSRFHLDPAFPKELSDRVKREWVANVARGERGDALLVATSGRRPVGFLAVLTGTADGVPSAVIDLIAVDPPLQGRGYGRALVEAFIERYAPTHSTLRVGTQAANVPSLVFYERAGFHIAATQYVLHLHAKATA